MVCLVISDVCSACKNTISWSHCHPAPLTSMTTLCSLAFVFVGLFSLIKKDEQKDIFLLPHVCLYVGRSVLCSLHLWSVSSFLLLPSVPPFFSIDWYFFHLCRKPITFSVSLVWQRPGLNDQGGEKPSAPAVVQVCFIFLPVLLLKH